MAKPKTYHALGGQILQQADNWLSDEFQFTVHPAAADDGPNLDLERFASSFSGYETSDHAASPTRAAATFSIANGIAHHGSQSANVIDHANKVGIGTWDIDANGTATSDLSKFDFGWYYNWQAKPLWTPDDDPAAAKGFVPMIWGADNVVASDLDAAKTSASRFLLGFNEPDNAGQSNLSVAQALRLWPELMATGKLLGSPATTTTQTLGDNSWLGKFMDGAEAKGYNVDFVAVHYYSDDPSISAFRDFLKEVRHEYGKPVWVTEWALVDWNNPDRFTDEQMANFAHDASNMMDDLRFVKRHSWFGTYAGGDGWNINSELLDADGHMTKVGHTFADLML